MQNTDESFYRVTVILPAVIIHLLDIKSSNLVTREMSLEGFALCMQVLQRLRQTYSAADYATHFLEAAIKKAGIPIENLRKHANRRRARYQQNQLQNQRHSPTSTVELSCIGNAISIPATAPPSNAALTPPPDMETLDISALHTQNVLDESDLQLKLESFLQSPQSPHDTVKQHQHSKTMFSAIEAMPEFSMPDVDDESNMDAFLGGHGDCDPFLGHEGTPGMYSMLGNNFTNKSFELGNVWCEGGLEDMSKILDGVDLSFDDVIQVLETEIN